MTTHIGLLRAVNLGSHNKVAMADLRALVGALGLAQPRTLLQSGNLVFLSMQIALDPRTGEMVGGDDVAQQAQRALKNVEAILDASSSAMARILRTTIYLADLADYHSIIARKLRYIVDWHAHGIGYWFVLQVNHLG
jgi:enamine deaminase RidA (YjgF/YER057c/UK114 family)